MKTIHMIRTDYTHWGEYTAFNSFLNYFDPGRFKITMRNVPVGDERFRIPITSLKNYYRKKIRVKGVREYKLNDLAAEISVFFHSLFKNFHLVHFIDAEHSMMFLPGWYRKYRWLKSFPKIVATFHQPPSIIEPLINIDIVKQVDRVLVVSPVQAEYFARYLPRDRVHTILLGVDTQHFQPLPGNPARKKSKKFRCLSGGFWLRDYQAIFKTAKLLRDTAGIEFHLVVAGLDPPPDAQNIIFHENIPDAELLDLYQTCDVLFLPMRDATANTFLLEGSACGLPVVSTDLPSIKTYFPGQEAILVKDNDPAAFARVITDLYNNPSRLSRMSKLARKRAMELSWNNICKEYERLYLTL
jgi:glycosyltransferase involved in cell wall biosynthesis